MNTSQEILNGLKDAMIAERTGIEFYRIAAERTDDEKGKEVFSRLGEEEKKHLEYLRQKYHQFTENTGAELTLELPSVDLSEPSPIFSPELKKRINQAHWEMTALSVGLALEQASIVHYREMAEKADNEELRRFFLSLMRWEETHAAILQKQFNYLREDYWQEAGFAPF